MKYFQGISLTVLVIVGTLISSSTQQYNDPFRGFFDRFPQFPTNFYSSASASAFNPPVNNAFNPPGGSPFDSTFHNAFNPPVNNGFNPAPNNGFNPPNNNGPQFDFGFQFPTFAPFNFNRMKLWYEGPNVCREVNETIGEKLPSDSHFNLHSCNAVNNNVRCSVTTNSNGFLKTVRTVYRCCEGFHLDLSVNECIKRESITPVDQLQRSNLGDFVKDLKENGLDSMLQSKKGEEVTIFVPKQMNQQNDDQLNNVEFSSKDRLMNHFVSGIINLHEVDNEQTFNTINNGSKIRLNIFPGAPSDRSGYLYTANCVPIVRKDIYADNAIIHVVAKPLTPATENVMQLIRNRNDLNIFRQILEQTGLDKLLETKDGLTIIAPTDEAMANLDPKYVKVLKSGKECASNILKNHILDLTFCSSAVVTGARATAENMLNETVTFERTVRDIETIETITTVGPKTPAKLRANSELSEDEDDQKESIDKSGEEDIKINGEAVVIEADIMATNGALFIVNKVLLTESALPVTTILGKENATIFKQLIELGNFTDEFNALENVTFYAPTDKAFETNYWKKQLDENPASLKKNPDLREFLRNHIIAPMTKTCHLSNGMQKTLGEQEVRVNLYSTQPIFSNVMNRATVNCARIVHFDEISCGSIVHQVDRVIEPPTNNLLEMLENNPKYSKFLDYLRTANLTASLEDPEADTTLLVPTNDILDNVGEWFDRVKTNNESFDLIMGAHVLPEVICCSGIGHSSFPFTKSVTSTNGVRLTLNRNIRPVIQNAGLTKCDIIATNGVIHEINDVINVIPEKQPEYHYTLPFPGFFY